MVNLNRFSGFIVITVLFILGCNDTDQTDWHELLVEIQKKYPDFKYSFEINDTVQSLIDNWPNVLIDNSAQKDWGWQPQFDDLEVIVSTALAWERKRFAS